MKNTICLIALLCCSLYSQSQTAPSAVKPALPPNAPTRESVLHMLDSLKAKRSMELIFQGMAGAMKAGFRQEFLKEKPDATEEQLKIIDSMFDDSFKTINIDELLSLMVDIYQRHLTQADVDGIAAFYEGPVGQKYLTEQPAMIQESMQVSQQYALTKTQAASAMMQQKMREFIESISKEPETKSKPAPKATAPKKP